MAVVLVTCRENELQINFSHLEDDGSSFKPTLPPAIVRTDRYVFLFLISVVSGSLRSREVSGAAHEQLTGTCSLMEVIVDRTELLR